MVLITRKDSTRPAPATDALVTLRDVRISVSGRDEPLLHIPALEVHPGERIVITGPSGSGKSLLLATLIGRVPMGLQLSGQRVAPLTRIGQIPQRGLDALHPLIPVGRQLRAVTRCTPSRLHTIMDAVGLGTPELMRRRPAELSGGQVQRAAVALAALTDAPLVVADEPTSALDAASRDRTLQLLNDVITPPQALVIVTHDPAVAARMGGRQLRVEAGRVTEPHEVAA